MESLHFLKLSALGLIKIGFDIPIVALVPSFITTTFKFMEQYGLYPIAVRLCLFNLQLLSYSTHQDLSNNVRITLIGVHMQKLCHLEVDLPIFTTIIREDGTPAPVIHEKWARNMIVIYKTLKETIL